MKIQAVFFDMGGTLETYWHTPQLRLDATPGIARRLESAGIDLHLSNMELYEAVTSGLKRYHAWSLHTRRELSTGQIWCEFILKEYPLNQQALEAISEDLTTYYEMHYYHREMRPEIPAVLAEIRSMGLKIGLISNVRSRGQVPANLESYGIESYFSPVVLSSEYGWRKPDPAIFHYAARLASVPASACIYVGDRIARDVVGARKAGFRLAVQIEHNFPHGEEDSGAIPDYTIHQMTELVDILRREMQTPVPAAAGRIKAIIFDAGDILYYRPQRGRRLKAYLKILGAKTPPGYETEKIKLEHLAYENKIDQEQYRTGLIQLYGITDPAEVQSGVQVLDEEDQDIHFFEGIQTTLTTLKQRGFMLGIITDTSTPVSVKLRWFERGGFGNIWDSIISSRELGVRKPDPRIYQAALQQLGLRPEEAAFVGHKPVELEGASQVGLSTIAFNYEEKARADIYINNFMDLLTLPFISAS